MIKKHHGLYTVNNQVFDDKIQAIIYASEKKLGPDDISWDWYSDIFKSLPLRDEPEGSIDFYYKERAKQIREKYDYIVLLSSGGADSVQMCESFLSNGIHVDEIIGSAPLEGLSNWNIDSKSLTAENTITETFLAQIPSLEKLRAKYSVKITINDYFKTMLSYKEDEWLLKSSDFIHPTTVARYSLENLPHLKKIAESGKRMAVVYGIDKPSLLISSEKYVHMQFNDITLNTIRPPFNEEFDNVDTVAFYWSYDMPLLPLKMAHVAAKYAMAPENHYIFTRVARPFSQTNTPMHDRVIHGSQYQRAICPAIYPSTWKPSFQAYKMSNAIHGDHDYWYYNLHGNLKSVSMINSDIDNFLNSINPEFLMKDVRRLIQFGNIHYIGTIEK
mgnify:FL=1